jgi:hypothetical protein
MRSKSALIEARYDATAFIDWKSESGYSGAESAKRRSLPLRGRRDVDSCALALDQTASRAGLRACFEKLVTLPWIQECDARSGELNRIGRQLGR